MSVVAPARDWTAEQWEAIDRRRGDLLLAASAGSGKTSVLVERFVRAVLEDGVDPAAILTITFTDKAAAEMRDRIRRRLRELGAGAQARATEGAFISTIHGFCARVLRAHAVTAGLDPAFAVVDAPDAERLAEAAFAGAIEDLAEHAAGGVDLIAAYGAGPLRAGILAMHDELRSRGERRPALPPLPAAPDLDAARRRLQAAGRAVAADLGAIADPSARVAQAVERLERLERLLAREAEPWPGALDAVCLPGGNGAALSTPACEAYAAALAGFRVACEHRHAAGAHRLLDRLLRDFGERYAASKRERSSLDFEDLELFARDLLASEPALRERYRARFAQIMVDELQDTNAVQLELIESLAAENLFTVGDAQQSIYGFRHADVELFERRGECLARAGARATLQTNFRTRQEILRVINQAFAAELGRRFRPLAPGRADPPAADPRVELLIADKGAEWASEGEASPWRLAEARALAARIAELVAAGAAPGEIVVLTRAGTDLRTYERALEAHALPTYVIGGRGYWSHPQVIDLVVYLRALANPRDEEALYLLLASPLVAVSPDGLVVLARASRDQGRGAWSVLREPAGALAGVGAEDQARLAAFSAWFAPEQTASARLPVEALIDRALERTGYDLHVLALPGGRRRLANVRKLMRLAREHEAVAGPGLRGFLDFLGRRASEWAAADVRESEAPVEGEAVDAVRLMTIHRAKGLEFDVVCVADLGRGPRYPAEILRVGRDGRFGLRLSRPGTTRALPALDYAALGEERAAAESAEERRLFYVAMTRARERLLLSGAARLDAWPEGGSPIAWIGPAVLPGIAERVGERTGVSDEGVRFEFVGESDAPAPGGAERPRRADPHGACAATAAAPAAPVTPPGPPVPALSYSALGEYHRCGYRFYAERVLGLPVAGIRAGTSAHAGGAEPRREGLSAAERGVIVHALLERLDFRRPSAPSAAAIADACAREGRSAPLHQTEAQQLIALVEGFTAGELGRRLARATQVRREQRFRFALAPGVLITGALDVLAREPGRMLVVDYKTDRLEGGDPAAAGARRYATQRLIYALAVLRSGAEAVEVAHVFLEHPGEPIAETFTAAQMPELEGALSALARGVLERRFAVTDTPHRGVCDGCPAEGGLCSWPLAMTRREAPDRLF
ncbi:MAG: UvrD-helicase domain-containing protein [Solirubrobacterales bacterium]|nr:UvrD-helicase domain-containing protein [Solirubrobacterales bacterium]